MVILEVENMDTKESGLCEARDMQHADKVLLEKGFERFMFGDSWVGINEDGHEISVMKPMCARIESIKPLKKGEK